MKRILLIIVLIVCIFQTNAQNISGVINSYASVNAINLNVLTVNSTTGFNVGDKVLIIKMKGALINQANTQQYGDTTSLGEAGKYTFSTVIALTPTTLTLSPFCNIFSNTQYLQVVTVPIFPNPIVTANLSCQGWDGATGGILIFETPNTLTLNADINISNLGYRGGDVWGNTFSCGTTNFFSPAGFFGPEGKKGEGVAEYIVGQECGRGKLANGGGGAFGGNGGAAGGANVGKGGDGGFEFNGCFVIGSFAYGGQPINQVNTALIMGGGGGGPQSDNAQAVFNGGNGGGIIYITANEIVGNGNAIQSNGETTPLINDEGASGGGAGGSIYLNCPTFTTPLTISAIGGNGGSNNNVLFPQNCHGPGGGGGGGLVWLSGATTPAGVTVATQGGLGGFALNPLSTCYNTQYNAGDGNPGVTNYNFVPAPPPVLPTVNLGPDQLICAGSTITLDAGANYASYLWDDNSNGQIRNVTGPGTFYITVTTPQGCTASDTIIVNWDTSVIAAFDVDIRLGCTNDTVIIINNSSAASTQFAWSFGDGVNSSQFSPTHVYSPQGIYTITLIASNPPCYDTIQKVVNLNHPIGSVFSLNTIKKDSVCLGSPIIAYSVSVPLNNVTHSWNWGDGAIQNLGLLPTTSYTYPSPGNYTLTLTVTDTLGCTDTSSLPIYVEDSTSIAFTIVDDKVCVGEPVYFNAVVSANTLSNTWSFGDGSIQKDILNTYHTYDNPLNPYTVWLKGSYAVCPEDSVSMPVIVGDYLPINLGPDTSICPGITGSIILSNSSNPNASINWSTGEVGPSITVTQPSLYWATIASSDNPECTSTDSVWVNRDCYVNIPNVFSPDGDGLNDYFLPREILSSGVSIFKMNIYNRWGENIFTTTSIDGRGWDGKYNGVLQPMGVYIYTIDVVFKNNMKKSFTGNVTLIR